MSTFAIKITTSTFTDGTYVKQKNLISSTFFLYHNSTKHELSNLLLHCTTLQRKGCFIFCNVLLFSFCYYSWHICRIVLQMLLCSCNHTFQIDIYIFDLIRVSELVLWLVCEILISYLWVSKLHSSHSLVQFCNGTMMFLIFKRFHISTTFFFFFEETFSFLLNLHFLCY